MTIRFSMRTSLFPFPTFILHINTIIIINTYKIMNQTHASLQDICIQTNFHIHKDHKKDTHSHTPMNSEIHTRKKKQNDCDIS